MSRHRLEQRVRPRYGRMAAAAGSPRAARATGNALGSNPIPIVVPCHRVVHADGGREDGPRVVNGARGHDLERRGRHVAEHLQLDAGGHAGPSGERAALVGTDGVRFERGMNGERS